MSLFPVDESKPELLVAENNAWRLSRREQRAQRRAERQRMRERNRWMHGQMLTPMMLAAIALFLMLFVFFGWIAVLMLRLGGPS